MDNKILTIYNLQIASYTMCSIPVKRRREEYTKSVGLLLITISSWKNFAIRFPRHNHFVGTKEKHYFDHSHSAEFQAGSSSSSSFISLFVTANFTGYSRLLGEETSRNHQAYIERPPRHHNIIRNKGCEEVRLN